jgi:flagellar basal-body rod protein FlgF
MSTSVPTIARQVGLMSEMQSIANNIANSGTTGFRREGVVFSEYVQSSPGSPSLSMAAARVRNIDLSQGTITETGGRFDLAIRGEGFFAVDTEDGQRLTRAGHFIPNAQGDLVTPDGHRLLDAGGAAVFVPPDARSVTIAADGTVSADGDPIAQIGVVMPEDPLSLRHEPGVLFAFEGATIPAEDATLLQGKLENSNVNPILEISRMIEVQRAYELGQAFLDRESDRRSKMIDTLTR